MKNDFPLSIFIYFAISVFALLILGTWQLNKNHIYKKNNLKFELNSKSEALLIKNLDNDFDDLTYVKFNNAKATNKKLYLEPRTLKGNIGFHQIRAFKLNDGYFLVNQGFVLAKNKKETKNNKNILEGYIIKIPKPKFFELDNDFINKVWYSLHLQDIEREFNIKLSPYILYEQKIDSNLDRKAVIPNLVSRVNHLNYAFTWYFLYLSLCVIFFIYFKKNCSNYE